MSPVLPAPTPVADRRLTPAANRRPGARARLAATSVACAALAATALAGCGDNDDRNDGPPATTAASLPIPRTVPAVSSAAADRGVVLEARNHGLRLWMRPSRGDERRLRATIQVMPTATVALRRRLARTTGVELGCETDGTPSQGAIVTTTGPRDVTPVGHRISTGAFLTLPKGRTAPQAVRSCRLVVAPERRGSNRGSYPADPATTVAVYRFR